MMCNSKDNVVATMKEHGVQGQQHNDNKDTTPACIEDNDECDQIDGYFYLGQSLPVLLMCER